MSIESVAWALNVEDERMSPAQKLVLVGIANHDGDGGAWPSVATLARYAGIEPRSVTRAVVELERWGYVTRHQQRGGTADTPKDRRPNRYELHRFPQGVDNPGERGDSPVTPSPERGDPPVTPGVTPRSPEPSLNRPQVKNSDNSRARPPDGRRDYDQEPTDPDEIMAAHGIEHDDTGEVPERIRERIERLRAEADT